MDNNDCNEWFQAGNSTDKFLKAYLMHNLPKGIDETLFCTRGIYNDQDDYYTVSKNLVFYDTSQKRFQTTNFVPPMTNLSFKGPCKGDEGGPLIVEHEDGRKTLEGIVSENLICNKNSPTWYTRVRRVSY